MTASVQPTAASFNAPGSSAVKKDFGFLPIPQSLRHEGSKGPFKFGLILKICFVIASTFTVGNLYYCQPLLVQMSHTFGVPYNAVSRIPTLLQAGYAVGMLLVSPLGDLVRRRPLLLLTVFLSTTLTIGLAITPSFVVFEVITFFVGVFTVTPQVLIPLAADLAPPDRRASAVSVVLAGLLFGILAARVLSGIIAEFASWRVVYYMAIGVQFAVLVMLYSVVPDYPAKNTRLRYHQILLTMAKFAVTEPFLIQSMLINMLSAACFSNFWVTLTFLLAGPPYHYSTLVIGLFGLVGMAGVAAAPFTGRLIDRMVPWCSVMINTVGLLLFGCLQTGLGGVNVSSPIIVAFFTDIFRQMQQVSLTSTVMGMEPDASARLNSIMILLNFTGQVLGTAAGTNTFVQKGWRPAAALIVGWNGLQLLLLLLRGPHCERYTWFGYENGCELRKSKALENKQRREAAAQRGSTTEKELAKVHSSGDEENGLTETVRS